MAYLRPVVLVYQEYAKLTTASASVNLTPCIIGPCYYVVNMDSSTKPLIGTYVGSELASLAFPPVAGSDNWKIDESSGKVVLENITVDATGTAINQNDVVINADRRTITFSDPTIALSLSSVKDTDTVLLNNTADSTQERFSIRSIDMANNTFTLTREISDSFLPSLTATNFTITFTRFYEFSDEAINCTINYTAKTVTVPTTLKCKGPFIIVSKDGTKTLEYTTTEFGVLSADVYFTYRMQRTDLLSLNSVSNQDEAESVFGQLIPENPLGYAVSLCLANSTIGVRAVGVRDNELTDYAQAVDVISSSDDVYSIIPLTRSTAVLTMLKNHAELMSTPTEGKWRIVLGNSVLQDHRLREVGSGSIVNSGTSLKLTASIAKFIAKGVRSKDDITFTVVDTAYDAKVVGVISDTEVLITKPEGVDYASATDVVAFVITQDLTSNKTAQAEYVRDISKSYNSARFVNVWPDKCVIKREARLGTKVDQELEGYFLAAILGGMIGGLPSHHGFTRLAIGGVDGVRNSSEHFNAQQLDTIASGGTFIFMQHNPKAPVFCRHQLTTDMSTIEFRELSFVKNFDYVSYLAKNTLDRFLGQYNITPQTLNVLYTALEGMFTNLKLHTFPKIGSPVLGHEITSVRQLDDTRDRVEIYVDVHFPYVLNVIGLHLVSQ